MSEGELQLTHPGDGAVLAELHRQSFDLPWDEAAFEALLLQQGMVGIHHTDGFILARVILDEAEILTLAVNPVARRSGLGLRLVEAAAQFASRIQALRLCLEVAEDNAAARALYAKAGFKTEGRRKAYYARSGSLPFDALILSLKLAG
jgi:ribosomal-protein-alanine N-acetyltransferase